MGDIVRAKFIRAGTDWEILRVGMDFQLKFVLWAHYLNSRVKFEKV